jgi:hypothetical protein
MAAIELFDGAFHNKALSIKLLEDILYDFSLDRGRSTAKFIETDIEPAVNIRVDGVITVAEFLGAYPLLGGPVFCGSTIFISTAYIEGVIPPESTEPGKGVGGQDLDKITEVGHIINIGERGGN